MDRRDLFFSTFELPLVPDKPRSAKAFLFFSLLLLFLFSICCIYFLHDWLTSTLCFPIVAAFCSLPFSFHVDTSNWTAVPNSSFAAATKQCHLDLGPALHIKTSS